MSDMMSDCRVSIQPSLTRCLQVNSANQTKFLTHLGVGIAMIGGTGYKLWSEVG